MLSDYFISPNDIPKLINVCETFDKACQDCVDNATNPDYETTHDFGFSFEQLKMFAEANKSFDFQKLLPKHKNIISYFFSDSINHYQNKAHKRYLREMEHYARMT